MGMDYSDTFSSVAAGRAGRAESAASANLDASILAIKMIKEMRDWEAGRFNELIVYMRNMKEQNLQMEGKIQLLQEQVAGLQSRLYNEQEKNKAIAR